MCEANLLEARRGLFTKEVCEPTQKIHGRMLAYGLLDNVSISQAKVQFALAYGLFWLLVGGSRFTNEPFGENQ